MSEKHRPDDGLARSSGLRLTLPPLDGEELARSFAGQLARAVARPSFRAGVVVSTVTGAVCMRSGMRPWVAFAFMMAAHASGERLYQMAEDIHETAVVQRAYLNEQLRRQGQDWLDAHPDRAGQPADGSEAGPDAPGDV